VLGKDGERFFGAGKKEGQNHNIRMGVEKKRTIKCEHRKKTTGRRKNTESFKMGWVAKTL